MVLDILGRDYEEFKAEHIPINCSLTKFLGTLFEVQSTAEKNYECADGSNKINITATGTFSILSDRIQRMNVYGVFYGGMERCEDPQFHVIESQYMDNRSSSDTSIPQY